MYKSIDSYVDVNAAYCKRPTALNVGQNTHKKKNSVDNDKVMLTS